MTQDPTERERVIHLLLQLPEKEAALHALGAGLMQSLRWADIHRTPEDLAYGQEVARRIYEAAPPERRDQFREWFGPNGLLRLWSD